MRNQPTDRFIHIDKLQLHYLEWGNEQAQSMVLLHNIGDNAHIWDHFARNAADHVRIIAPDQRGLIPGSYGKQTDASVERIVKAAETSIGTASSAKEIILKQKVSLLIQLEQHLQELTNILTEQCKGKMRRDMDILTSMRGIGKKTAMNFLIEVGREVKEFESHKKVIAMAGLDPALYQSGKIDRKGKITKRGNRHLRRVIWVMTTKVIQFNERFKQYYLKRIQDGLPYKMAVLATAHKLIRVIFAMLTNETLFNARMN
jgi:transposase